MPAKLDALVGQGLSLSEMPVVGPISAGHLQAYVDASVPPAPQLGQIETMMGKLSIALPKREMSDEEANERLDLYWQALKRHALPDLQQAFMTLLRTCKFFPTIAEIEAAVAPIRGRRTRRLVAARLLLMKHQREWRPSGEPLTADEVRQLGSILADPMGHKAGEAA
ncbi:hypothetical protein [Sphingobium fuliginis]|uniref:hypothetical protein n=2 Tax=Sphingobium TaxID=165695 RepID=UPI0037C66FF6